MRYSAADILGGVDLERLPGGDLTARGLRDLADGRESEAALLVLIGAPRLRRLGLDIPPAPAAPGTTMTASEFPEHRLYARLAAANPDSAHSRYNALIRMLVSFERTAECALT